MRRLVLLAAGLILSGAAGGDPQSQRYDFWFGATPSSPIAPPVPCLHPTPGHELCHRVEADYIANYRTVVPLVIRSCGASFVSFEDMTDGKESASFNVDPKRATAVVACVKQQLPQGYVLERK